MAAAEDRAFVPLFPEDGIPKGWSVRAWDDVKNRSRKAFGKWKTESSMAVSHAGPGWLAIRSTATSSSNLNSNSVNEQQARLRGVRFPGQGDPAFDGMEIQMADFRYNPEAKDSS